MAMLMGTTFVLAVLQTTADPAIPLSIMRPIPPLLPPFTRSGCGTSDEGDILVCGKRDNEHYRLRPLPPLPEHQSALGKPMDVKIGPVHWHGLSVTIPF